MSNPHLKAVKGGLRMPIVHVQKHSVSLYAGSFRGLARYMVCLLCWHMICMARYLNPCFVFSSSYLRVASPISY